ncbi:MAG TPA: hypothetical protein VFF87_04220 [Hyphomicrobium sp.]|nr:hypothetical protein [Hyphomicrobium sp.]
MPRLRSAFSFFAIFTACLAGALGISPWAAGAAAAALVLVSLNQHQAHYGRYAAQANVAAQSILLAGSVLNALMASTAAFVAGRAIGWLWGL